MGKQNINGTWRSVYSDGRIGPECAPPTVAELEEDLRARVAEAATWNEGNDFGVPQVLDKKKMLGRVEFEVLGNTFATRDEAEAARGAEMRRRAETRRAVEEEQRAVQQRAQLFADYDARPQYLTQWITTERIADQRDKWFGLLGQEDTGLAQIVDSADLADKIYKTCRDISLAGYEVVAVMPVQSGVGAYRFPGGNVGGAGWGYSFTSGVVITARRVQ